MEFLAEDRVILENAAAETREEYEKNHLTEDIAFPKAVMTKNSAAIVRTEGP